MTGSRTMTTIVNIAVYAAIGPGLWAALVAAGMAVAGCRTARQLANDLEPIAQAWLDGRAAESGQTNAPAGDMPPAATTPTNPITPAPTEPEQQALPDAPEIHKQIWSIEGASEIRTRDGGGGFKWNSERGKVIWPGRYSGKIVRVYAFTDDGAYHQNMQRAKPDEYGQRQRYYLDARSRKNTLPAGSRIRADLNDGGQPASIFVTIPNPKQDYD